MGLSQTSQLATTRMRYPGYAERHSALERNYLQNKMFRDLRMAISPFWAQIGGQFRREFLTMVGRQCSAMQFVDSIEKSPCFCLDAIGKPGLPSGLRSVYPIQNGSLFPIPSP
jgi:hypothetical protein